MKKKDIKPNEENNNADSFATLFESKRKDRIRFENHIDEFVTDAELLNAVKEKASPTNQEKTNTTKASQGSPEEQIDLHGLTAQEAAIRVDAFLYTARKKGLRKVRIITGKGLHSEGGAVLPDVVEARLLELKKKRLVHHWEWENKVKHRSGAVIVIIQK